MTMKKIEELEKAIPELKKKALEKAAPYKTTQEKEKDPQLRKLKKDLKRAQRRLVSLKKTEEAKAAKNRKKGAAEAKPAPAAPAPAPAEAAPEAKPEPAPVPAEEKKE